MPTPIMDLPSYPQDETLTASDSREVLLKWILANEDKRRADRCGIRYAAAATMQPGR